MKRGIAKLLIISFLTYINCARVPKSVTDYPDTLASCKATLVESSLNIPQGKKGTLVLTGDAIHFKFPGSILDIPYDKIISARYDEKRKKVLPRRLSIPPPNQARRQRGSLFDTSFTEALLEFGLILIVIGGVYLVLEFSKRHIYLSISFNINKGDEWVMFKMPEGKFDKIYPILSEKIGLT